MKKRLKATIDRFQKATNSLEAYKAISEFVQVAMSVPKYIAFTETEGEIIHTKMMEIHADKGWNRGLKGADLDEHNRRRGNNLEALFQLDPIFPIRNLHNVHLAIQKENLADNTDWLFSRFGPDDPLPDSDRKEYQLFLDKVYKAVLPFLKQERPKKIVKLLDFDPEKSELTIKGKTVRISLKSDKTNAHHLLKHMFSSSDGIVEAYFYSEMIDDSILDPSGIGKDYWRTYHRAALDVANKVRKQAKFDDFLTITTGISGSVKINEKYLK